MGTHAPCKLPRLVAFVEALPKTSTGKLLWRVLQAARYAADGPARAAALQAEAG